MAATHSALPAYQTKVLSNGLEVVAIPLGKTGVITTDIFYKVGSRNERMGKSGIAHMLEHLNFKSTSTMKAGEFDEIVKGFGGVNNASTGFDYTHYFIKSSRENLDRSLALFADLMANLALKDEEFQPERSVVAEERRWRTDNSPMGMLYFRLFNTAFVYHPYHWTPIGFMNDIQTWSIDDIRSFHATYYQPRNAIVVVAGDVDPSQLFELAQRHFGSIANGPAIPAVHMKEPLQDGARRAVVLKETESQMIAIAFRIPPFDHADQPAISALSELLSSGKSSRLQKRLVDGKRLANQIYAYPMDMIDDGLFIIIAVANPGVRAEELETEIWKELAKLAKGSVTQEELDKVKINTRSDFVFALESSSSVADLYGSYLARGNMAPLLGYEESIGKLDRAAVTAAAKRYFDRNNSTTIILKKED